MTEELLKNTCFHEINDINNIPGGYARIVSLTDTGATMHTRPDSADNFEPVIPIGDKVRLFLITSYNENKAVIDAGDYLSASKNVTDDATVNKAKTDERQEISKEKKIDDAMKKYKINFSVQVDAKKVLSEDELLEALQTEINNDGMQKIIDEKNAKIAAAGGDDIPEDPEMAGGKRTRRRKNHGSKRRNASNKSGRRASKQSRRRGKKQSKRHGRK
jgi:hypothetical protein